MKQRLLLVGGGHSHLAVLADLARRPLLDADVVLLSAQPFLLYSGMLPGMIAGHYSIEDCRIPLEPLAAAAHARFVVGTAVALDPARGEVKTAAGEVLGGDVLSLDVGSTPAALAGAPEQALSLRPLDRFPARWEELYRRASRGEVPRIAVAGSGAAGVEIALAIRHRLASMPIEVTLLEAARRILPGHGDAARRRMERILRERGVLLRTSCAVVAVEREALRLSDGTRLPAALVWATGAAAPAWVSASGLAVDARGFIAVDEGLRSLSHPRVFAAGDVASVAGQTAARSGVRAVRQGSVLARNLRAALGEGAPSVFRPPVRTLALIACGERYALASWGTLALEGRWLWHCKDRIDRRYVSKHRF